MPREVSFALIPSPLVSVETFEPLRVQLAGRGYHASVIAGTQPEAPPYWESWAESIASALPPAPNAVLVAHSGAGPVADLVAERAAGAAAVVYLDGTLLAPGSSWLDTVDSAALESEPLRSGIARGIWPNPWRSPDLWERVGVAAADAVRFAAGARELPVDRYREPLPLSAPDVPHGYIAFAPNPFYAPIATECRERGWPVRELPGMHFHFLVAPNEVTDALLGMVQEMGVSE